MAATKAKSEKTAESLKKEIFEAYIDHVLMHDKQPVSVYAFCKTLKIKEEEFYTVCQLVEDIESLIWQHYAVDVIEKLQADETFGEYSVREKILAFFFTFFEDIKKNRSLVNYSFKHIKETDLSPKVLKKFKHTVLDFSKELLSEAIAKEEIEERRFISDRYVDAFWFQLMFLIRFWKKDTSSNYEKTDAAIEKSVNLAFDLAAKSPLDGILDFAKFLYQNK